MSEEQKFPSELIDLPSEGRLYPNDHPLKDGKIEIKYMTAKEEDILTSTNLIKKGIVIDKLLDSLILTKNVVSDDLVLLNLVKGYSAILRTWDRNSSHIFADSSLIPE